jgi:hypothetical protein
LAAVVLYAAATAALYTSICFSSGSVGRGATLGANAAAADSRAAGSTSRRRSLLSRATGGDGDASSRPKLLALSSEKWGYDRNGKPIRSDIFCTGSLVGSRPPLVAQAIDALCKARGDKFFSGSGLDTFMAGRFGGNYSYGAGLWDKNASAAPWMFADYLIRVSQQQDKADGWKRVVVDGQLDFVFCTSATCEDVVDLQSVFTSSNGDSTRAFSMSGLKGWFSTGLGTIQPSAASLGVAQRSEYLAPELARADVAVTEVAWSFFHIDFLLSDRNRSLVLVLPAVTVARVASSMLLQSLDTLLHVGHFRASTLLCDKTVDGGFAQLIGKPPEGDCITLVVPDHPGMRRPGWSQSSEACRPDANDPWPFPILLFDSYFPQAHMFGDRTAGGRLYVDAHFGENWEHEPADDLTPIRVRTQHLQSNKTVAIVGGLDSILYQASLDNGRDPLVGRCGVTLDPTDITVVVTHQQAGCVVPCDEVNRRSCGVCSVLKVCNTSIAAVPLFTDADVVVTALRKMVQYATRYANESLPWQYI